MAYFEDVAYRIERIEKIFCGEMLQKCYCCVYIV